MRKRSSVGDLVINKSSGICQYNEGDFLVVSKVNICGATFKSSHPDNCVELKKGKIFRVKKILVRRGGGIELHDIYMVGYKESRRREVFDTPTSSIDVDVIRITAFMENQKLICTTDIK